MHLAKTILFLKMKKLTLILLLTVAGVAQNILITVDHTLYHFLDTQESLGRISSEYWSTRPYTITQVNQMLAEVESFRRSLTDREEHLLDWYQHEFRRELSEDGITFPWNHSNWSQLLHPDFQGNPPLFMTYKQENTKAWISWSETFRIQNNGKASRGYHTDHVAIAGEKGPISFTTQYTFHRVTRHAGFTELPDTYKEGYLLDRDYMKWINWGYPTSSLTYTHPDFKLGIHRQPIYWGYSPGNSPILSNNVNPLPHIEWTTQIPHLRFKFLHARLTPNDDQDIDSSIVRRNLSAHRVEFDITPNFEFSFNEFVVYAHRDFELGYLNPVNFLFAEEQAQGDLDNKLMALDFKWHLIPGLTSYGTWFFDELDFWKLFSGWWGNKFVFQLGATYYPTRNLPSLNVEYTAARPWTYSHIDPINSFSSGGRILGLKNGPNTTGWNLRSNWLVSSRLRLLGEFHYVNRGDDLGANIFNSYHDRGNFEEEDANFISGNIVTSNQARLWVEYYLNTSASMHILWVDDQGVEAGIQLKW